LEMIRGKKEEEKESVCGQEGRAPRIGEFELDVHLLLNLLN